MLGTWTIDQHVWLRGGCGGRPLRTYAHWQTNPTQFPDAQAGPPLHGAPGPPQMPFGEQLTNQVPGLTFTAQQPSRLVHVCPNALQHRVGPSNSPMLVPEWAHDVGWSWQHWAAVVQSCPFARQHGAVHPGLAMEPSHMIVLQRVAPVKVVPAQPEECRSARVRLALVKSARRNCEEYSSASHRLAPTNLASVRVDECMSTPGRLRPE